MDYKGIKEFMLILDGEVWRVYANSEQEAKSIFLADCRKKSDTKNEEYMKYWTGIHNKVLDNKHILIENTDFYGVRFVTN